ncbi:MAG TPA: dipeptidase [Acidobacteriota bacterium]|jgi:membrane dipeptidase
MKRLSIGSTAFLMLLTASLWSRQSGDDISRRARQLHFSSLVLDTHIDTTLRLRRPDWSFTRQHSPMPPEMPSVPESAGQEGHVDLPRIRQGGLGALFFGVVVRGNVTGPQAVNDALEQIAAVHKLAEDLPNDVAFCTTAEQVRAARRQGRIAALIGLEGGHMINNSLPILRTYRRLGVRYITVTHFYHTDWADSSGQDPKHNGLTGLGKEIVREFNRIGMMLDISHVSDKTFWDILEVSRAPLIASHSSCRTLAGHVRNMSDEMIRALAGKGGVIHINYNAPYLDESRFQYWKRTQARERELAEKYPGQQNAPKWRQEIAAEFGPPPKVNWERIIEHIDHVVKIAGVDHVGLGSDFDGATMPEGMEDVSKLPRITEALLRRGYRKSDIQKILGENTLRVMEQVDRVAAETGR